MNTYVPQKAFHTYDYSIRKAFALELFSPIIFYELGYQIKQLQKLHP